MRGVGICITIVAITMMFIAAASAVDFSAEMEMCSAEGRFCGKMNVSGDKTRMEIPGGVAITRMDKNIVWMLIPEQRMYMEQPVDRRMSVSAREKVDGELERKELGIETINGRVAKKYLVTYDSGGRRESVYQWIDQSAGMPVKTAAVDGSWSSEFRNIDTRPQDPALFEIPTGYQKMSMGGIY